MVLADNMFILDEGGHFFIYVIEAYPYMEDTSPLNKNEL